MGAVKLNLAKILGRSHAKPSLYVNVDSSSKSDIKCSKATGALISLFGARKGWNQGAMTSFPVVEAIHEARETHGISVRRDITL